MNLTVFIDTDNPVHTTDRDHPLKEPCARILRMVAKKSEPCVIVSEILQKSMHRYPVSGPGCFQEVLQAFT